VGSKTERTPGSTCSDWAAPLVALLLVGGTVGLAMLGKDIPSEISIGDGAAVTWLFVRSTADAAHRTALLMHNGQDNGDPPKRPTPPL